MVTTRHHEEEAIAHPSDAQGVDELAKIPGTEENGAKNRWGLIMAGLAMGSHNAQPGISFAGSLGGQTQNGRIGRQFSDATQQSPKAPISPEAANVPAIDTSRAFAQATGQTGVSSFQPTADDLAFLARAQEHIAANVSPESGQIIQTSLDLAAQDPRHYEQAFRDVMNAYHDKYLANSDFAHQTLVTALEEQVVFNGIPFDIAKKNYNPDVCLHFEAQERFQAAGGSLGGSPDTLTIEASGQEKIPTAPDWNKMALRM